MLAAKTQYSCCFIANERM